jgi:hypothetical protein
MKEPQMNDVLADYDADARERVWKLLEVKKRRLSGSTQAKRRYGWRAAGMVEAKPHGGNRGDFYAGPAVMDSPGTVLVVLAHNKKAFTLHLIPTSGHGLADGIEDAVAYVKEGMEAEQWTAGALVLAIEDLIKKYGRAPGQKGDELTQEHNVRIIGCLFAGMSDEARADLVIRLETVIAAGICPALIGLIGKGTKTGLCAAWPLPLTLAPYADAVIKE